MPDLLCRLYLIPNLVVFRTPGDVLPEINAFLVVVHVVEVKILDLVWHNT